MGTYFLLKGMNNNNNNNKTDAFRPLKHLANILITFTATP